MAWKDDKQYVEVAGKRMAYVERGEGEPLVFLHGNPTSSYLWRDVMAQCAGSGRCVALDLIGMGDSDPLDDEGPGTYRFVEHRQFVDGALDALGLDGEVVFVVHDWGSALGFDWANRHRDAVKGIAFMEAIVAPLRWKDFPEAARDMFRSFRSDEGEELILRQNAFVEMVLPGAVLRHLTEEEMDEYRRPYTEPGDRRRPTLTWPREIPLDGEPADVVEIVESYGQWLSTGAVPTLFVNADPGAILTGRQREFVRSWPNQTEVTVPGIHFVQEDSGADIGRAVADFVAGL